MANPQKPWKWSEKEADRIEIDYWCGAGQRGSAFCPSWRSGGWVDAELGDQEDILQG
ncbi:hypothetical protein [Candidatus Nitrospira neomarina]|uniref:Uncharacterized protein n=1 Tax=Candidatus Nitrospira neomarina TaxID=3020899 RepID=A0AA96JW83_9BACT|nr:hypothetical protein [Candidatus Nitrospira neomarina]WNM62562.1 hypothetical protein PQG83_02105 [Candidatus Nitrospira neomarina]